MIDVTPRRGHLLARTLLLLAAVAPLAARAAESCQVGLYRLADGQIVDIAPSDGDTLRWRKLDGETGALKQATPGHWQSTRGWTGRPDGISVTFDACPSKRVQFAGQSGRRMPLQSVDASFDSHSVRLVGRLLLPPGHARVPVVVLVHGAERDSARSFDFLQRLLPAQNVGAFVYDKRGTGGSGGRIRRTSTCSPTTPSPRCTRHVASPAIVSAASATRAAARAAGWCRLPCATKRWISPSPVSAWPCR
jgi:hypothetical protein